MLEIKNEVLLAEKRIRSYIRSTPLEQSLGLSQLTHSQVYVKCENFQSTGSFKVRGAFNKLLSLSDTQQAKGVVTASSGNHGAAVAYGMATLGIAGKVFVPVNVPETKIDNIRYYNVPLEFYANDCAKTEMHALEYAAGQGMTYISPYNDWQVIAGQGTIGREIMDALQTVDAVFVPVSGGGLISGIGGYIKAVSPHTKIIGCLPENSPVMAESIKAAKIVEVACQDTLSDATLGGIIADSITLESCKALVDEYVLVTEEEIKRAICLLIAKQHCLVEGAGALALAGLLKCTDRFLGKNIVLILSGANISLKTLKTILRSCVV